jgi:hypothetical protein
MLKYSSMDGHLFMMLEISIITFSKQWEIKIHPNKQSAYTCVKYTLDLTANQLSLSTYENAITHLYSLNKRTLYALDLTTHYSNQH